MLKWTLAACLAASMLPNDAPVQPYIGVMTVLPPMEFQGNNSASIEFMSAESVNSYCRMLMGPSQPPENMVVLGCTIRNSVVMPNPCSHAEESYAALMCHELGHVNGWTHRSH